MSALGSISKYGSAPTGFTLARGASNWTLSTTVGAKVDKANLTSTDYTLTAQLGSAPASGVTWKLNGSTLSDSAATTLTSTGTYASTARRLRDSAGPHLLRLFGISSIDCPRSCRTDGV